MTAARALEAPPEPTPAQPGPAEPDPAGAPSAGGVPAGAGRSGADAPATPGERLRVVMTRLLVAGVDRLAGAVADQVDGLADKLDDIRENGGAGLNAMIAGGLAQLRGQNPLWAAIKAGVSAMKTSTKVVIALLLILTAVLAPVLALVLAIVLLIVAAVQGARSNG